MREIRIFDTTLRDGEQSPGYSMNTGDKLRVAKQLARLGVDVIEAGFAIASPDDFKAIETIAGEVTGPIICSLARAVEDDIKAAWMAIRGAEKKRIHTFHSTSEIHLKYQHENMTQDEALRRSVAAVMFARGFTEDVQFSPMDATRTDINYLCEVVEAVIEAGATTVNIPDTVGYSIPAEFGRMIKILFERVRNINKAVIAVHCHNDLGLSTANSLAAVLNGAGQIECTINGIGERAGNCSLEESVMALKTRKDFFQADTNVNTKEIKRSSTLVTNITGMSVQANKAIVGSNAFAHEAGIHQDGLLKNKSTYEIMKPEDVGASKTKFVLGKHSGRHAFKTRLSELGYALTGDELEVAFKEFKSLADKKGEIFDEDLVAIVDEGIKTVLEYYRLKELCFGRNDNGKSWANVVLQINDSIFVKRAVTGVGAVDAVFKAIADIACVECVLDKYEVEAITGGTEAIGKVFITLKKGDKKVRGYGANTDIIKASAKSYINALNKLVAFGK